MLSFLLVVAGVYALCTRAGMGNMTGDMEMSFLSHGSVLMAHCDGFAGDCDAALFGHMRSFSDMYPGIFVELFAVFTILFVISLFFVPRQIDRSMRIEHFFVYFKRWRKRFLLSITAQKFLDAFRSGILHPKYHA